MTQFGALLFERDGYSYALIGALVFGTAGYWAIIGATRTGEVSVVAPFRYTRLVFALLVAMIFLGERPSLTTLIGAAIVVGSGLYAFARERSRRLQAAGRP